VSFAPEGEADTEAVTILRRLRSSAKARDGAPVAPKATRVCFSYKSVRGVPPPHVSAAKQQLEDLGYRVKWGLDVSRTAADWRNVWMRWCEEADFVVNFLSVDYVKKGTGEACADEWCIAQVSIARMYFAKRGQARGTLGGIDRPYTPPMAQGVATPCTVPVCTVCELALYSACGALRRRRSGRSSSSTS
jgi:hypothetical protein